MAVESRFPNVHLIGSGGISSVYQVDCGIVVKVPNSDEFSRQQFLKEIEIYKRFSRQTACAFIVQCFHLTDDAIFLENMRDQCLAIRIQGNHDYDWEKWVVIQVNKLEPLHLRLAWMNGITQAIAFLESLTLAHGDLRPENILLHDNKIKVTDFDNTAPFGTPFWVCMEPWGRELTEPEIGYDTPGCPAGLLGPRTEQFALGSMYYYINYGMAVYEDKTLTVSWRDRGIARRKLFQDMQFPVLDCDPMIDELIHKCWHNQFPTIASLAAATKQLFDKRCSREENEAVEGGKDEKIASDGDEATKAFCQKLQEDERFGHGITSPEGRLVIPYVESIENRNECLQTNKST
ncbi:protein kinase domain-containing protein [Penicillium angulare]|uniref:protein kinase domain-containing protein n=1 Tax=Penicillium angulare TaxID=116970 RepID=UPI002541354E|nr:protein kinase domain-containing protein [Penicillium angulare]KAJ5287262.1 protein kinase domain-containing protein [Penicillium angulare]